MNLPFTKGQRIEYKDAAIFVEASRRERVSLGGIVVGFHNDNLKVRDWPQPFFTQFRTQKPVDIEIKFHYCSRLPLPSASAKLLFDGQTHWQLFEDAGHYFLKLFESKDDSHNRSVVVSKDLKKATVYLNKKSWVLDRILRPFLEILLVNYMASRGGLLLHGAAVRDGKKAYLFVGESGSGKTTMSQWWAYKEGDISVLGDERLIVRREADGWFVYGTPWPGLGFIVSSERVPISNIFLIRHGKQHEVIPQSKPWLFQKLFTQVFSSFWDYQNLNLISETCEKLIQEVPCHELGSLKDASITDFVREFAAKND